MRQLGTLQFIDNISDQARVFFSLWPEKRLREPAQVSLALFHIFTDTCTTKWTGCGARYILTQTSCDTRSE